MAAAAVFIVVNLVAPFVLGDMYPFTLAPMFRDEPVLYCEYEVRGPDDEELDVEHFALARVYDGNPRGMGVGIVPPITIDRFGLKPTPDEIKAHVKQHHPDDAPLEFVKVTQRVIGPIGETVGVIEENEIVVELTENEP